MLSLSFRVLQVVASPGRVDALEARLREMGKAATAAALEPIPVYMPEVCAFSKSLYMFSFQFYSFQKSVFRCSASTFTDI